MCYQCLYSLRAQNDCTRPAGLTILKILKSWMSVAGEGVVQIESTGELIKAGRPTGRFY